MSDMTVHMVVKNENRWVWFALMAVKDVARKILVTDTGSTDRTVEVIKTIDDRCIELTVEKRDSPKHIVDIRRKQINATKTKWILIVDGDEIWPRRELQKLLCAMEYVGKNVKAIVVHDKRCVGDVFHTLPAAYGRYLFKGKRGHMNLRAVRNFPGLDVRGVYPNEYYVDGRARSLNNQDSMLSIVHAWYLHTTHLQRSTRSDNVFNRVGKQKFELGERLAEEDLPEVFALKRPSIVPSPYRPRSIGYTIAAAIATPMRRFKQRFVA